MAGFAGHSVGVVGGNDLRESFRLGDVRLVTADAQHCCIEFGGLDRAGVVGMFRQRSVACLAIDVRMPTISFFPGRRCGNLRKPGGRRSSPGGRRLRLRHLRGSVHTVRNSSAQNGPYPQKREDAADENSSHPKKVPCVFERIHKKCSLSVTPERTQAAVRRVTDGRVYSHKGE